MNLSLNKLLLICALTLTALFLWKYQSTLHYKVDSEKQLEQFIKERALEYKIQKEKLQKDSVILEQKIDSAERVYRALEVKRKTDNNYYQKRLNELKKVNTFTRRQLYADSLARAMR